MHKQSSISAAVNLENGAGSSPERMAVPLSPNTAAPSLVPHGGKQVNKLWGCPQKTQRELD
jgi:hypothetical protein